ncbi:type II 3-dehydroquinate dehydratase [Microbacterium sp. APC 3898]|uniref:3-dehydroquinate dehydratase n=2 Tax=Planococcus TaxID=1372 RepID=A0ABT7ZI17_9BACL|nr:MULTISPECIES: type II 3-dehydroquinate dehydratase [Terrabacteria group]MBD8015680.1 type II 3-dehydroquinate dehydratase [Planococcus wigleyi]MDN3426799.1 type II 3-dehydroquinate dehydratase [Planococcus sp. APC 4016]MDN3438054.1 type II 3-dehydroquinate dehydratase [Planococcus sp. APC 3900]MDN3500309.1 type II 3-dehydroquinate dehydratase [Microbacterium sp. APC 3898]
MRVLILNGPNLNRLGKREKEAYGTFTLEELEQELVEFSYHHHIELICRQSNHEGELIDWIHGAGDDGLSGIVLNAGAYTHTSIAIRDAIAAIQVPVIEVHISNVHKREEFRHHSYIAPVTIGQIVGFGQDVYKLALHALILKQERG